MTFRCDVGLRLSSGTNRFPETGTTHPTGTIFLDGARSGQPDINDLVNERRRNSLID